MRNREIERGRKLNFWLAFANEKRQRVIARNMSSKIPGGIRMRASVKPVPAVITSIEGICLCYLEG